MTLDEALDIVIARTGHTRFRALCDPDHPDHDPAYIPLVMRMAESPDDATPTADFAQTPEAHAIPLAGDLVEALARRIGADRLAKWVEAKTGQPCACEERRQKLNRLDEKLRRFLSRGGTQ